jgi:hypothetical protein
MAALDFRLYDPFVFRFEFDCHLRTILATWPFTS